MELVLLNDKVKSTELDEQEEITLSQALNFISIGRTTFLKILAQNRPQSIQRVVHLSKHAERSLQDI